jgi:hypothetical protein
MSRDEKDQRAELQPDADAEPSKKEPLTHQQRRAALGGYPAIRLNRNHCVMLPIDRAELA